jgi:hypothetical protein
LYLGKISAVLGGPKRMQATSEEAQQAISNGWAFLHNHRGRTHYLKLRRGGYPLGRGGIESANKFICHTRLKRSGAWWYESNGNLMLPYVVPSITAPLSRYLCVIKNDCGQRKNYRMLSAQWEHSAIVNPLSVAPDDVS